MLSAGGSAARDAPTVEAHPGRHRRRSRVAAGARRAAPTFSKVTLLDSSPCTSTDGGRGTATAAATTTLVRGRPPAAGESEGTTAAAGGGATVPASRRWFQPTLEVRLCRRSASRATRTCSSGQAPHGFPWEVGVPDAASGVGAKGDDASRMPGRSSSHSRLFATPITIAEETELDSLNAACWLAKTPLPSALVRAASDDTSRDGELEF